MALINCPECAKEISDKVKACPHCGYPLIEEVASKPEDNPQQVEITSINLQKQINWKPYVIALLIILVGVAIFLTYNHLQKVQAQRDYELAFNAYIDDLLLLRITVISGGAKAEELTNLTAKVWANSIYEDSDPETDKYTRINGTGRFYDDFNKALQNLFTSPSTKLAISDIEDTQDLAKEIVGRLQSPPEGLEKSYDIASNMYASFLSFTNFAINPSGSLQTFNQERRSKSEALLSDYNKLEAVIPEKFDEITE